jgi:hypothetical protein
MPRSWDLFAVYPGCPVYGFITDLVAGTTTTGYPPHAPEVIERATHAGRYWFLMAAWLQTFFIGVFTFGMCGWAWRSSHAARRSE